MTITACSLTPTNGATIVAGDNSVRFTATGTRTGGACNMGIEMTSGATLPKGVTFVLDDPVGAYPDNSASGYFAIDADSPSRTFNIRATAFEGISGCGADPHSAQSPVDVPIRIIRPALNNINITSDPTDGGAGITLQNSGVWWRRLRIIIGRGFGRRTGQLFP